VALVFPDKKRHDNAVLEDTVFYLPVIIGAAFLQVPLEYFKGIDGEAVFNLTFNLYFRQGLRLC
jgi:hypothetical protein